MGSQFGNLISNSKIGLLISSLLNYHKFVFKLRLKQKQKTKQQQNLNEIEGHISISHGKSTWHTLFSFPDENTFVWFLKHASHAHLHAWKYQYRSECNKMDCVTLFYKRNKGQCKDQEEFKLRRKKLTQFNYDIDGNWIHSMDNAISRSKHGLFRELYVNCSISNQNIVVLHAFCHFARYFIGMCL